MQKKILPLIFFGLLIQVSKAQKIEAKKDVSPSIPVISSQELFNSEFSIEKSLFDSYQRTKISEEVLVNEKSDDNKKSFKSSNSSSYYDNNPPANMLDKYNLKPSPGNLAEGLPNFNEDLLQGKVNISIPLAEFSYYDYKIPITLNNRYPQDLSQSYGEPTFYLNSRVGGDWTLSIDEFKVSRQVNGVKDEDPNKGYYSTFSQGKVLNPNTINNNDVLNGLSGDWDTSVDIFSFTTPTISGTFFIDIINDSYEILSDSKFHVEYNISNNEILSFRIYDSSGNEYLFGGDTSTIEVSQSITDVYSFGTYRDRQSGNINVKYIIETNSTGNVISFLSLPSNSNIYVSPSYSIPQVPPTNQEFLNDISDNNKIDNFTFLVNLGSVGGKYYYAAPDFYIYNEAILLDSELDDPEMRREKVNTAWYLKEIKLFNGKKINFSYNNLGWVAYPTFSSNKIQIATLESTEDIIYSYNENYPSELENLIVFGCFPQIMEFPKFPINESHTYTTHFVKKPKLTGFGDEEGFQYVGVNLDYDSHAPYYDTPNLYSNAPQETQNAGIPSRLIGTIFHRVNNCEQPSKCITTINFNNRSDIVTATNSNNQTFRIPWKDRSYLDDITINEQRKFYFEYDNDRLRSIQYPTGATKIFNYHPRGLTKFFNAYPFSLSGVTNVNPRVYKADIVDEITTETENNETIEKYEFSGTIGLNGAFSTLKTFRPDVGTCTSSASFSSSSPIFNSHFIRSGRMYTNAKKFINGKLQLELTHKGLIESDNYLSSPLVLTNGSSPSYLNDIRRPSSYKDEQIGLLLNTKSYNTNFSPILQNETNIQREYEPNLYSYPAIYLTNIEAGPWQNTNGAIRRGYSTYYYPFENNLKNVTTINTTYENNNSIDVTSYSEFKRVRIPSLGLNNHRQTLTLNEIDENNFIVKKFISPIEVENLVSTNSPVQIQNYQFYKMLSKNNVQNVEYITYKSNDINNLQQGKILNASSTSYTQTPNNNNGYNFPVIKRSKSFESDNYLNLSNYQVQSVNSSNQIEFDNNLNDKIVYDKYDSNGRPIEFHTVPDFVYSSVIWGYKNQFPIVIAKNSRYQDIQGFEANIKSLSNDGGNEQLINEIEILRNSLPDAQVTSYTYLGNNLESVTDVKGNTKYYEYDSLQRLTKSRDDDGNILTKYRYHYENVVDNPINGYISSSADLNSNTVTFTLENVSGGSGNYSYSWSSVEDGTPIGPTNSTSFQITYDCLSGDNNLRANLTITDTNDPNNVSNLYKGFWDLDCCPPVTANYLEYREIRTSGPSPDFQGIQLKLIDVNGGCSPLRYDWKFKYQNNPNQLYDLISTTDNNLAFIPEGDPNLDLLCDEDVIFECHVVDLGLNETTQPIYYFQSNPTRVDCNDVPR